MRPEDIKRLTDAKLKAEHASRAVTTTSLEVKEPIQQRGFDLQERYEAEGMALEARQEVGEALKARVDALTNNLWSQEENPQIKPAFQYPHKETKKITAEGFVPLYITLFHEDGPDADPVDYPEGHITLTDTNDYWGLHQNDKQGLVSLPDLPQAHARLEDDINTLERLHDSLGLELPE